jgi:hypothetical protein
MSTLYVGNLAWGTTQESLLSALEAQSQANIVSCDVSIVGNGTRGWAIVECGDEEAANAVINTCNGMSVEECALTVRLDANPSGNPNDDNDPRFGNPNDQNDPRFGNPTG